MVRFSFDHCFLFGKNRFLRTQTLIRYENLFFLSLNQFWKQFLNHILNYVKPKTRNTLKIRPQMPKWNFHRFSPHRVYIWVWLFQVISKKRDVSSLVLTFGQINTSFIFFFLFKFQLCSMKLFYTWMKERFRSNYLSCWMCFLIFSF